MRFALLLPLLLTACTQAPPNVVFILADDLGWNDTGAYGSTFHQTPHLDRLAAEGLRFTRFYSAGPNCSPTRASIQTGRYPARLGITHSVHGRLSGRLLQPDFTRALPLEERTLGEIFQQAGYATGYLGKWHLGEETFVPGNQGYETVLASNDRGHPASYFAPYKSGPDAPNNVPDLESDPDSTYLTDRLTDLAVSFIREHADRPFLLFLSHYAVHTPLHSKAAQTERFRGTGPPPEFAPEAFGSMTRLNQGHAVYAGMLASLDEGIGRVLTAIEQAGIEDHTIVVFTSDNGGLSTLRNGMTWAPTSVRPLRAGKGWLYEGGIRIPLLISGPGIDRGTSDVVGSTTDLLPTLLALAGLPPAERLDGVDLMQKPLDHRPFYWHFPHYPGGGNTPSGAIRAGRYKLIEWFESNTVELYDLETDPGETHDLSESEPGTTEELLAQLRTWRTEMRAMMPTPNPDYEAPTNR